MQLECCDSIGSVVASWEVWQLHGECGDFIGRVVGLWGVCCFNHKNVPLLASA